MDQTKAPVEFFDSIDEIKKNIGTKDVFIFLDYDGTLTPIVATPDLAIMGDDMRKTVHALSQKCKVSIVSGRATDDVKEKVSLDNLFYAGSHGFEIVSPDGSCKINDQAQAIRPIIDQVYKEISDKVKNIKGSLVEHVKYTISTHYRLVDEKEVPSIEKAVDEVLKVHPELKKSSGKKVFELKPKIEWHKGKAVEWILKVLNFDPHKNTAIYIGDNTTDEDAFKELKGKGFGILVAEQPKETEAEYIIKDTEDVKKVLEFFINSKG